MSLHVIVPWASSLSPGMDGALKAVDAMLAKGDLPHWQRLLRELPHRQWQRGDEYAPHTPHELAWAAAMGWIPSAHAQQDQVCLPQAAWLAAQQGVLNQAPEGAGWGLLTPCHWAIGHDSLSMLPPEDLALDEDDSRALLASIQPWFEAEGWQMHWVSPLQWLVSHPSLSNLVTASLDRVSGRNPDVWMPQDEQARLLRRLQAEVQMLWFQHPVNAEREARQHLPVNSFWLSGCGTWPAGAAHAPPAGWLMADALRLPMLRMDMAAWLAAWQHLDSGAFAQACKALDTDQMPGAVTLTLCGERHALTLSAQATHPDRSVWQQLRGLWTRRRSAQAHQHTPSTLLSEL